MNVENLERWLLIWEETLKDPRELLLDKSFVNVAQAVPDEPTFRQWDPVSHKVPDSEWKRRMLRILQQSFDADTLTVSYLSAEHPADVSALRVLLHDPRGYDTGQIVGQLNNIRNAPSVALLRRELHRELLRDPLDEARLRPLLRLLLRHYVTKVVPETLALLPKKVLTRRASSLFLKKHLQALIDSAELNAMSRALMHDLLFKRAVTKRARNLRKKKSSSIFDVFDDGLWWNLSYRIVEDLADPVAAALRNVAAGRGAEAAPPELLLGDAGALRGLGSGVVEGYVRSYLRWIITKLGRPGVNKRGSGVKKIGMRLGDYLLGPAGFEHDRLHDRRPNTLDLLSAEGAAHAAAKTASVTAAGLILSETDATPSAAVGRLVATTLNEADGGKVRWDAITDERLNTFCAEALARKAFHRGLGELLRSLNEQIHDRLQSLANSPTGSSDGALPDAGSFWEEWVDSFSIATGIYTRAFDLLPWPSLSDPEFGALLDECLDSIVEPQKRWLVCLKVRHIAPQGAIWSMGNVTFYDPAEYDFGEGRWLIKSSEEAGDAVTFAKVAVTADTDAEAASAARRQLQDALNVLSFDRSAGVRAGGLNPEVDRNSYVANVSTRGWTGGWRLTPAEMPGDHGALYSDLTSVAAEYDGMLGVAARQPGGLTELQEGFLRALYWYRKGRWETDPAEKFSFYWIALEHLLKDQGVRVPYILAKLHITWRDVSGRDIMRRDLSELGQFVYWREEAVTKIKADPPLLAAVGASPELAGWDSDPNLLLRPEKLDALLALVPAASEHRRYFTEYRDDMRETEGNRNLIAGRAESMRDTVWFMIRRMYRVRNQLFHEALTHRPDIGIYAAALESVLEDTLRKMEGDVTSASPRCRTMSELVEWYQEPWL